MNEFRTDLTLTRGASVIQTGWECIGRHNVITDEISRALGLSPRMKETKDESRIAIRTRRRNQIPFAGQPAVNAI